jgi:hypothetical protein
MLAAAAMAAAASTAFLLGRAVSCSRSLSTRAAAETGAGAGAAATADASGGVDEPAVSLLLLLLLLLLLPPNPVLAVLAASVELEPTSAPAIVTVVEIALLATYDVRAWLVVVGDTAGSAAFEAFGTIIVVVADGAFAVGVADSATGLEGQVGVELPLLPSQNVGSSIPCCESDCVLVAGPG